MSVSQPVPEATLFHRFGDFYYEQFISKAHPDIMDWPLVRKEWQCWIIMACYAIFINYLGPAIMKNKKPLDLRWLMIPYNILLVFANFYIFKEFAKIRWSGREDVTCENMYVKLDPKTDPHKYRLVEVIWYFYMTKYIELLDTVIFVLRKKERQLSRLHIIHHTTVPMLVLYMLRSEPRGYNSYFPLANAFVHCIMYTYYGVSALGDEVTIHLRFKKYVTMTQLIQFILVLYYFISRPFVGCQYNWVIGSGNLIIAGFFFLLFCNFYWNEYCKLPDNSMQNGFGKNKKI